MNINYYLFALLVLKLESLVVLSETRFFSERWTRQLGAECTSSRFSSTASGICMSLVNCQDKNGIVIGACMIKSNLFGGCCHIPTVTTTTTTTSTTTTTIPTTITNVEFRDEEKSSDENFTPAFPESSMNSLRGEIEENDKLPVVTTFSTEINNEATTTMATIIERKTESILDSTENNSHVSWKEESLETSTIIPNIEEYSTLKKNLNELEDELSYSSVTEELNFTTTLPTRVMLNSKIKFPTENPHETTTIQNNYETIFPRTELSIVTTPNLLMDENIENQNVTTNNVNLQESFETTTKFPEIQDERVEMTTMENKLPSVPYLEEIITKIPTIKDESSNEEKLERTTILFQQDNKSSPSTEVTESVSHTEAEIETTTEITSKSTTEASQSKFSNQTTNEQLETTTALFQESKKSTPLAEVTEYTTERSTKPSTTEALETTTTLITSTTTSTTTKAPALVTTTEKPTTLTATMISKLTTSTTSKPKIKKTSTKSKATLPPKARPTKATTQATTAASRIKSRPTKAPRPTKGPIKSHPSKGKNTESTTTSTTTTTTMPQKVIKKPTHVSYNRRQTTTTTSEKPMTYRTKASTQRTTTEKVIWTRPTTTEASYDLPIKKKDKTKKKNKTTPKPLIFETTTPSISPSTTKKKIKTTKAPTTIATTTVIADLDDFPYQFENNEAYVMSEEETPIFDDELNIDLEEFLNQVLTEFGGAVEIASNNKTSNKKASSKNKPIKKPIKKPSKKKPEKKPLKKVTTKLPTNITTTTTTPYPKKRPLDYRKDCGIRPLEKSGRIVGGTAAPHGRWPWHAHVRQVTWWGLFSEVKCGGVLISEKYVLTAGHCKPGSFVSWLGAAYLQVILGSTTFDDETKPKDAVVITRNVKRFIIHPGFNPKTYEHDIAIMELESPIKYEKNIVPICMPNDKDEPFEQKVAYVIGVGLLQHGGERAKVLQEVDVPIIENQECQDMFERGGHPKRILDSFICGGRPEGEKDACTGDSGGTLGVKRPNGQWVLAGTVSHGIFCALPNLPGIYMRTNYYRHWIKKITRVG